MATSLLVEAPVNGKLRLPWGVARPAGVADKPDGGSAGMPCADGAGPVGVADATGVG